MTTTGKDIRQDAEQRGRRAETVAGLYLRVLGWKVMDRRFSAGRGSGAGEVDLVVRRGSVVAFVEVKARPSVEEALESVTPAQRSRIVRGAEAWIQKNPAYAEATLRFDVVAVVPGRRPVHVPDAWRPGD